MEGGKSDAIGKRVKKGRSKWEGSVNVIYVYQMKHTAAKVHAIKHTISANTLSEFMLHNDKIKQTTNEKTKYIDACILPKRKKERERASGNT